MRPLQGYVWGCALAALLAGGGRADAAWNNVFQVCCHNCSPQPAPAVSMYAADPCPQPCPQPVQQCTTRYVQRSYYQPVTTYKTTTYYEPVTTYQKSYYYETVTSYRYSCYYDPCTCRYQQVAQPCTSYRLRERCCPVTSYLQRTCTTPVTSYRQACYYEPVTTCCTTTTGAAVAAPPAGATLVPPAGGGLVPPAGGGITEDRTPNPSSPPAGITEDRAPGVTPTETRKPNVPGYMPPAADTYYRQPRLRAPVPAAAPRAPAETPPAVRADRIASRSGASHDGKVVGADRSARPGSRVLFVSADDNGPRQVVTADRNGTFRVNLASGDWLVYVYDANGRASFSRRIEVARNSSQQLLLVAR